MTLNVLITGSHGRVGTAIRSHLGDRDEYEFTYIDIDDHPDVDTVVADITAYDEMRSAFESHDAVVHLAGEASPDAPWERFTG